MVGKLRIDKESKALIISGFTNHRATSSKDMFVEEATAMIKHLKELDPDEQAAEKMRKKIISLAHEMGWQVAGSQKADMKRIDGWCKKFGYKHKNLNNYTYKELPALVTQFENGPYKHYISSI